MLSFSGDDFLMWEAKEWGFSCSRAYTDPLSLMSYYKPRAQTWASSNFILIGIISLRTRYMATLQASMFQCSFAIKRR